MESHHLSVTVRTRPVRGATPPGAGSMSAGTTHRSVRRSPARLAPADNGYPLSRGSPPTARLRPRGPLEPTVDGQPEFAAATLAASPWRGFYSTVRVVYRKRRFVRTSGGACIASWHVVRRCIKRRASHPPRRFARFDATTNRAPSPRTSNPPCAVKGTPTHGATVDCIPFAGGRGEGGVEG